jgi:hypothetical protein
MPGLIGQHLPTGFVPNPPLGSSTLLFDNTGVLSIKRNDGSVETVGGSGSVSIDLNQISFGTSTGLTSSVNFVIDGSDVNLIFGYNSTITGGSTSSVIMGGSGNTLSGTSSFSSIISGYCNTIATQSCQSSIIGGRGSEITCSNNSIILGGDFYSGTPYCGSSGGNKVIGGQNNFVSGGFYCNCGGNIYNFPNKIYDSISSSILGGDGSVISDNSYFSSIIGGRGNTLCYSSASSIIGGAYNTLSDDSGGSSIIGGVCNTLSDNSGGSSIIGGNNNTLSCYSNNSSIIGGNNNALSCYSCFSSIIGGNNNSFSCYTRNSSLIGGFGNAIFCYSCQSSIIGGFNNVIGTQSCNSVILGGNNLTLNNQCNTALTQHLWIAGSVSPNNGTNFGQTDDVFVSGVGTFSFINGVFTGLIV